MKTVFVDGEWSRDKKSVNIFVSEAHKEGLCFVKTSKAERMTIEVGEEIWNNEDCDAATEVIKSQLKDVEVLNKFIQIL